MVHHSSPLGCHLCILWHPQGLRWSAALSFFCTFKVTPYYDKQGNPVKSILTNYNVRYTETATANGKTLLTNFPAVYITSFPSGAYVQLGLRAAYTVPGAGVVLFDAGRISFDPSGAVLFEAGQHQLLDGSLSAFCSYLGL